MSGGTTRWGFRTREEAMLGCFPDVTTTSWTVRDGEAFTVYRGRSGRVYFDKEDASWAFSWEAESQER